MLFLHPPFTIHHYATIGSTNDQLKAMVDAPEFTCVTAAEQTAGRGRRERAWHSAPGDGLYLSVLLRPEIEANKIPLLSLLAAVAVAETILSLQISNLRLDIKWPNDVLLNDRKVSGILIESTSTPNEVPRFIVGVGVNLNHQSFPPELSDIATSLHIECGERFDVTSLRNALLDRLAFWYEELRHRRERKILQRWQELSSYARGKQVVVIFDHEEVRGETIGLNDSGALQLQLPSGEIRTILAGEIKHLRQF
ncbi:MAG TPA: biotin--[acetyl-CoA-carboxylase] ligase [Blastocatellia bacterium]|nr:biotin--[acetyl-CoA-carboxylase] ligase [Blastocatellia bacterium]